jgi:hypothetical protein
MMTGELLFLIIGFTLGVLVCCIKKFFDWMEAEIDNDFDGWMERHKIQKQQDTLAPPLEFDVGEPPSLSVKKVALGGDCAYCLVTGAFIGADVIDSGGAKYTAEFDAWISKEGQEILKERNDNEAKIILEEWSAL